MGVRLNLLPSRIACRYFGTPHQFPGTPNLELPGTPNLELHGTPNLELHINSLVHLLESSQFCDYRSDQRLDGHEVGSVAALVP